MRRTLLLFSFLLLSGLAPRPAEAAKVEPLDLLWPFEAMALSTSYLSAACPGCGSLMWGACLSQATTERGQRQGSVFSFTGHYCLVPLTYDVLHTGEYRGVLLDEKGRKAFWDHLVYWHFALFTMFLLEPEPPPFVPGSAHLGASPAASSSVTPGSNSRLYLAPKDRAWALVWEGRF